MFHRILIANRGEVAARVHQTCIAMGIVPVLITTDADANLGMLKDATDVAHIGGARSYLDLDAVLQAGTENTCTAVHPGWGFLSENPTFAARCESEGMTFIGPRSSTMRLMADKAIARETMASLGLPTIPGSDGLVRSIDEARSEASRIGYPVLLKAVSGGGGRGMRIVRSEDLINQAFEEASAEALGAFGDDRLYLEKLIENGRHIEFQVVGDGKRVQVLGERECSIQRRHQKLLEETPSPGLAGEQGAATRRATAEKVRKACEALGYRGAGTIEMLLDDQGNLYFMEMNTRLQVEHTVTEEVTGVDLVEAQIRVAANEHLGDLQQPTGCAIQCRINAEDVSANFRPCPGEISKFDLPAGEGIRVDTHLRVGDSISPHYDSMIAKVIASGPTREIA
ncbi:MAG: acetyl-CoA carboxylase biotin carboxylase subunit, partial [Deltaproteobacteria bacterium]|nr:acetyl-CoA carboxylase biotin carboxylase subunit [Deltaproteobacteria bacterium]